MERGGDSIPRKIKRTRIKPEDSSAEYDFHGLAAEEAARRLAGILDDNEGRSGFQVKIIHGKGTGALAEVVTRLARSDPRVALVEQGFLNPGVTTLVLSGRKKTPESRSFRSLTAWDRVPPPPVRRRKR